MSEDKKCFFCGSQCEIYPAPLMHTVKNYRCEYCGEYLIDHNFIGYPYPIDEKNKFKIACVLNERRLKGFGGLALCSKVEKERLVCGYPLISIGELLEQFPKKAKDLLNRTLLNLSQLASQPFSIINLYLTKKKDNLHLFTEDRLECLTIFQELIEQKYIKDFNSNSDFLGITLTTKSWEVIDNLKIIAIDNKKVFVAMWFDDLMNDYYKEGIKKAIEDAGYVSVRIDLQDFNGKICDEIIAEIKRTKFLVADFSGLRSGVFFEAGFAKGLGREVIFTVRKEDVNQLKEHFDTRQYNYIVYDSPEDLRKKLYNRIGATII